MEQRNLKISIITPSYNQGQYIEDTIQSILKQDYTNYEHIIIDGGSTDCTLEVLKKYDHLIWVSEKDRGQAHAINKGFSRASGDIIAWLNSDDYYSENTLGLVSDYFKNNPECKILYGDITFVNKQKEKITEITGDDITFNNLVKCPDRVRQPSTFWRRELYKELGGIDETFHLVMDFDFFLRVLKKYDISYLPYSLSYYRYYSENKSLSMINRQIVEIFRAYRKNNIKFNYDVWRFLVTKTLYSIGFEKVKKVFFPKRGKSEK